MNIFFDLDGTLIDSKPRLYHLFQKLVPESSLLFEEYWDLKRNKINHKKILTSKFDYSEQKYKDFENRWMKEIESEKWLSFDKPFDGVSSFLDNFKKIHLLYIVTARQSEEKTINQIANFGWKNIFKDVLVTQQTIEKFELIQNKVQISQNDWIIGDTGKDIETGKKLGIKTAAVLSGFLNKEKLEEYNPNEIIENVINFKIKTHE